MKVTIVTPSYNQAPFLERAIESIWGQSGDFELEHIVADGGSIDGSVDIIKRYATLLENGQFSPRCRGLTFSWWSRKDNGQSDALNQGFQLATGAILGWINSDDCFADDFALDRVCRAFAATGADIVVGNALHVDESGHPIDVPTLINDLSGESFQRSLPKLKRFDFIIQPSCLFRREIWERLGIETRYAYVMDWDLWIRAYDSGFRFVKIDDVVGCNRLHADAKTVKGGLRKYEEALEIFRKYECWCPNRLYHYIYWMMLRAQSVPWAAPLVDPLVTVGKLIRNALVQRFRLY